MKPYTAKERQHLNETLNKPLGPEYLSYRSGSFGRLTYITGGIAVQLANEIFGFDGWSSEIKNTTIDYVDVDENKKVNVGVSVTMRITLKDGTFREDIGYGATENARNKGTGIEKAKKHATTDAIKRTLKNFGNALGNCMYEKSYLNGVVNMGNPQIKFSPANLYRHEQYRPKDTPPPQAEQQQASTSTLALPAPSQHHHQHQQQAQQQQQIQQQAQQQAQQQRQQQAQQAQSLAQKRHQEQIELQQKRAKQHHHQEEQTVKQEPNTISTTETHPPLLPEESFSYEGDDEFYALFQEEFEDEFAIDGAQLVELEKISQVSNHSSDIIGGCISPDKEHNTKTFSIVAPDSSVGAQK